MLIQTSEASEMMAAAQMQPRQYHLYTPQSHSPVSAVSSHAQEQAPRIYSQPPQMQPTMYYQAYAMGHHLPTQPPHQMMTPPQSTAPQQQNQAPMPLAQAPMHASNMSNSPRAQPKFEPNVTRPLDTNSLKSPAMKMPSSHSTPKSASHHGGSASSNQGGASANPNAAPGPIPATTPLVVRQDNNGVQWISFEYSKDRVKMEYTIRCDVEAVDVDTLDKDFKEANCVYPRAFCDKGQYTGNRLGYETECNTVGWSLAWKNECLREKRGLIQRAVDSWRNSNQDSRLRSRRVRRMNKQSTRAKNQQANSATPQRAPSTPSSAMLQQRPLPQGLGSATPSQMHHHQANTDNNGLPSHAENMGLNGHFDPHQPQQKSHLIQSPSQVRPTNVFHGYPSAYPIQPHTNAISMAPPLQNGLDAHLSAHPATTISASNPSAPSIPSRTAVLRGSPTPPESPKNFSSLYPRVHKTFINISDPANNPNKVRVKLNLNDAKIEEVPDDFRERNSVFPRSYFRHQMRLTTDEKRQKRVANRFADLDVEDGSGFEAGRTTVKIPTLEGESEAPVPRLGKRVGEQEEMLNDSGYRIGWNQPRKYDKRVLFLQRSRKR